MNYAKLIFLASFACDVCFLTTIFIDLGFKELQDNKAYKRLIGIEYVIVIIMNTVYLHWSRRFYSSETLPITERQPLIA